MGNKLFICHTIERVPPRKDPARPDDRGHCTGCGSVFHYDGRPAKPAYGTHNHWEPPIKQVNCLCGSPIAWKSMQQAAPAVPVPVSMTAAESIARMSPEERAWAIREGYVREVSHG